MDKDYVSILNASVNKLDNYEKLLYCLHAKITNITDEVSKMFENENEATVYIDNLKTALIMIEKQMNRSGDFRRFIMSKKLYYVPVVPPPDYYD